MLTVSYGIKLMVLTIRL